MNILKNTTELAFAVCIPYADKEAAAVDATCGNGHDTLWLAEHFDRVYAFDIQQAAIDSTKKLLAAHSCGNVTLFCENHAEIKRYVPEAPKVILFNLGYLPGGDKTVTTERETTLAALKEALELLTVDGLLSITMYPGHEAGKREHESILRWAAGLEKSVYHCVRTDMLNQPETAPEVLWITKKK